MIEFIKRFKWWLFGIIFLGGTVAFYERWRAGREHSQDALIIAAATRHNVHPALVKAVVWRESWFDPKAKGTSGEIGLMQVRKPTIEDWAAAERVRLGTHLELFDPAKNTQCGAWYLGWLLRRYRNTDNPLVYALAAYNAGPTTITKWTKGAGSTNSAEFLRQMDYPGTKKYVGSVTAQFASYRKSFPPKGGAGS